MFDMKNFSVNSCDNFILKIITEAGVIHTTACWVTIYACYRSQKSNPAYIYSIDYNVLNP